MLWSSVLTGLAALVSVTDAVTVFTPPATYKRPGVSYARAIALDNGDFLVTSENYYGDVPYMLIFLSTDGAKSWKQLSKVVDTTSSKWGLTYHPTLLQIPEPLGKYPAGSIVFSATSVPADGSKTKLLVFVSPDRGAHWEYASTIAEGGAALENNAAQPVWHPFFYFIDHKLVCYFSDQRDPEHGSRIVHSITKDLSRWTDPVGQVEYDNSAVRPTIGTVSKLADKPDQNGGTVRQFILTYEFGGAPDQDYAVYYKISENPLDFGSAQGVPLIGPNQERPSGAPYVAFIGKPEAPTEGIVVISSSNEQDLYIDRKGDASGPWEAFRNDAPQAYARCVVPVDQDTVLVVGAGRLNPDNKGELNSITATIVRLNPDPPKSKAKRWSA